MRGRMHDLGHLACEPAEVVPAEPQIGTAEIGPEETELPRLRMAFELVATRRAAPGQGIDRATLPQGSPDHLETDEAGRPGDEQCATRCLRHGPWAPTAVATGTTIGFSGPWAVTRRPALTKRRSRA